uniref:hypothetical protein n=1 Tax=Stenotrophomonas maltophilia TaxID=40324 RepID=UPI0019545F05
VVPELLPPVTSVVVPVLLPAVVDVEPAPLPADPATGEVVVSTTLPVEPDAAMLPAVLWARKTCCSSAELDRAVSPFCEFHA